MDVLPCISFKDGSPVIVEDDDYVPYSEGNKVLSRREILSRLGDFKRLYYVDINGIKSNKPQVDLIRRLSARKELWADIGARDSDGITDAYIAGADRAVVSTKTIDSKESIERSVDLSDEIILSIDYDQNIVSPSDELREMDIKEVINLGVELDIETIVLVDLSKGDFSKPDNFDITDLPRKDYDLYVSGPKIEDLGRVWKEKIKGVILDLKEAVRYQKNSEEQ